MGECNAGAMMCPLQDLQYDLECLGTKEYSNNNTMDSVPSMLFIDNQTMV